jgi:DNA repair protein RadC
MKVQTYSLRLIRDRNKEYAGQLQVIKRAEDAVPILREYFRGLDREHFVVLALDSQLQIIGLNVVSIGDLDSTVAHPREVFKFAILANASTIFLAHNHPSGHTEPSEADITLTKKVADAGSLIGISVLDHLIITDTEWKSIPLPPY